MFVFSLVFLFLLKLRYRNQSIKWYILVAIPPPPLLKITIFFICGVETIIGFSRMLRVNTNYWWLRLMLRCPAVRSCSEKKNLLLVCTCVALKIFCFSNFSRSSLFSRLLKFYMPSGSLLLLSSHSIFKAYKWTFLLNKVFHIYLQSQLRRRSMTFPFVLRFYATKFHRITCRPLPRPFSADWTASVRSKLLP